VLKYKKSEVIMSSILYKLENGEAIQEKVSSVDVGYLLTVGYASTPEQLIKREEADTNGTGKLSSNEVKEAAKKAGITIGRKSIKTLEKELGL
jgi:hypothetical protein